MSLIPDIDPTTNPSSDYGALGLAGGKISSLQSTIASLTLELQQTKLDLTNKEIEADGLAYNLEIAQYQNSEMGNELIQLKDQLHQLEAQLGVAMGERDGVFKEMVGMSSRHTLAMADLQLKGDRLEKAMKEMAGAVRIGLTALEETGRKEGK
jgi:hypothetical protein